MGPVSRVRLVLRPLTDDVPVEARLRQALKCLLRSFRFRVVSIEWEEEVASQPETLKEEG